MAKEKKAGGAFSLVLAWAGANRKFLVASMVAATVSGLMTMVPYWGVYRIMQAAYAGTLTEGLLAECAAVVAVGFVVQYACFAASSLLSHKGAYRTLFDVRCRIVDHLAHAPLGSAERAIDRAGKNGAARRRRAPRAVFGPQHPRSVHVPRRTGRGVRLPVLDERAPRARDARPVRCRRGAHGGVLQSDGRGHAPSRRSAFAHELGHGRVRFGDAGHQGAQHGVGLLQTLPRQRRRRVRRVVRDLPQDRARLCGVPGRDRMRTAHHDPPRRAHVHDGRRFGKHLPAVRVRRIALPRGDPLAAGDGVQARRGGKRRGARPGAA